MSGVLDDASSPANSLSTSLRWLASQANALAPVSFTSASRSPVLRAASATLIPSLLSERASEAESPEPTPTISAELKRRSAMTPSPFICPVHVRHEQFIWSCPRCNQAGGRHAARRSQRAWCDRGLRHP